MAFLRSRSAVAAAMAALPLSGHSPVSTRNQLKQNQTIAVGGIGGDGGTAGNVVVTNNGQIVATGEGSYGIVAQSVGGGGGNAGAAINASLSATGLAGNALNGLLGAIGGGQGGKAGTAYRQPERHHRRQRRTTRARPSFRRSAAAAVP